MKAGAKIFLCSSDHARAFPRTSPFRWGKLLPLESGPFCSIINYPTSTLCSVSHMNSLDDHMFRGIKTSPEWDGGTKGHVGPFCLIKVVLPCLCTVLTALLMPKAHWMAMIYALAWEEIVWKEALVPILSTIRIPSFFFSLLKLVCLREMLGLGAGVYPQRKVTPFTSTEGIDLHRALPSLGWVGTYISQNILFSFNIKSPFSWTHTSTKPISAIEKRDNLLLGCLPTLVPQKTPVSLSHA